MATETVGLFKRKRTMDAMKLFAVIRTCSDAWNPSLRLEEQPDWGAHASFMNRFESEGFIVLGGPLEGARDVLLIVRATTADEIVERLRDDPWTSRDLLRVTRISQWTLRLGSLPEPNVATA
jgi:uncharacterized protein YciI